MGVSSLVWPVLCVEFFGRCDGVVEEIQEWLWASVSWIVYFLLDVVVPVLLIGGAVDKVLVRMIVAVGAVVLWGSLFWILRAFVGSHL